MASQEDIDLATKLVKAGRIPLLTSREYFIQINMIIEMSIFYSAIAYLGFDGLL